MAVEGLRNAERELLAFETAHPSIAPEPVPKGKHDLPDPAPEVAPREHFGSFVQLNRKLTEID